MSWIVVFGYLISSGLRCLTHVCQLAFCVRFWEEEWVHRPFRDPFVPSSVLTIVHRLDPLKFPGLCKWNPTVRCLLLYPGLDRCMSDLFTVYTEGVGYGSICLFVLYTLEIIVLFWRTCHKGTVLYHVVVCRYLIRGTHRLLFEFTCLCIPYFFFLLISFHLSLVHSGKMRVF